MCGQDNATASIKNASKWTWLFLFMNFFKCRDTYNWRNYRFVDMRRYNWSGFSLARRPNKKFYEPDKYSAGNSKISRIFLLYIDNKQMISGQNHLCSRTASIFAYDQELIYPPSQKIYGIIHVRPALSSPGTRPLIAFLSKPHKRRHP